jgi:hypothetical protein
MSSTTCVINYTDYERMRRNAVPASEQPDFLASKSRRLRQDQLAEESEARKAEWVVSLFARFALFYIFI